MHLLRTNKQSVERLGAGAALGKRGRLRAATLQICGYAGRLGFRQA